jgi:RNA polymerase sigma factor (sigma-70 family)
MVLRDGAGLGDDELLASFIERHDEAALAALIRRHGPMVWGVCRRLLAHHDAEDAFQATFLVLVRKATSVVPRAMVANWLYGVAHQTVLQARRTTARRRAKEVQVTQMPDAEAVQQDQWSDLQPILDEELNHLPDIYRAVIVLCDLESRTRREVARQLGVPEGTVGGRLARARVLLAKRLAQRGVVLSGGALATILSQNAASAGASASVVSNTIRLASHTAAGQATAGVISVTVAALTEGVLKAMLVSKLKSVVGTLMLVAVLAGGGVAISLGQPPDSPKTKKADPEPKKDAVARELNLLSTYRTNDQVIILIRRQQLQAEIDRLQAELPSLPAGTQLSVALAESDLPVAAGDLQTLLGPLARIRFGEKPAEWLTVRMNGKGAILDGEAAAVYWAVGVIKQLVPGKPSELLLFYGQPLRPAPPPSDCLQTAEDSIGVVLVPGSERG